MKVTTDMSHDYPGGINEFLRMEQFSEDDDKNILMVGLGSCVNNNLKNTHINYDRKSYLNLEHPCTFYAQPMNGLNAHQLLEYFDEVYSICPFTVDWLNNIYGEEKLKYTFYPFNKSNEQHNDKIYDVCYFGGLHSQEHVECVDIISKFNYRFISLQPNAHKITNVNIPNLEKLKIVSQSKIAICYHHINARPDQVKIIESYDSWENNYAFSDVHKTGIIPQFKCRVNEAAFCKTLNLVKRDKWRLMEDFYIPGEEFIYFDSNEELEELIRDITTNWEKYEYIVENAYKRVNSYSTEQLYNMINNGEKFKPLKEKVV